VRWSPSPRRCFATSRPATSTRPTARKSLPCFGASRRTGGGRWSWSRTTGRPPPSRTGRFTFVTAAFNRTGTEGMLALTRTLTFRYLWQRRMRALLIVLSIALGVGALVATQTLNETLGQVARSAGTPFAGKDEVVVVNGQAGLSGSLAKELEAADIPGLRKAWPMVLGRVAVPELGRGVWLVGVELDPEAKGASSIPEASIAWRASPAEMVRAIASGQKLGVVGTALASKLDATGTTTGFHVRLGGRERTVTAVGTVKLQG